MPRRPKTRVERLADACKSFQDAAASLAQIDMRTLRGELRDLVRSAREAANTGVETTAAAMREDVPTK